MSDLNYEELVSLVNKTLENKISEEEFKSLTELLSNNRDAQRIYLEMVDMHTALDDISFSRILKSKTPPKRKKKKSIINFRLISVAAILALAAIFLYKFNLTENVQTYGVIVEDSKNLHVNGQELRQGQEILNNLLELERGLLHLKFPTGAKLIVKGPARLEILSESHTQLYSGKIFAYVPSKAKGFSVTVGDHRVVDLGTSFAIEALSSHELHVFEGRVELLEDKSNKLDLKEGKAVKFGKNLNTQNIKLNKEKFRDLKSFAFPVRTFSFEKGLEGWTQTKLGEYFDRGDKESSELTKGKMRFVQSNGARLSNENGFVNNMLRAQNGTGRVLVMPFYARDMSTRVIVLSSPPFTLRQDGGDIEAFLNGGCGATEKLRGTLKQLGTKSNQKGFLGIALRRVRDDTYVASVRRTARTRNSFLSWEKVHIPLQELSNILAKSQPGEKYILDLVDSFSTEEAVWTWTALDTLTIPGKFEE